MNKIDLSVIPVSSPLKTRFAISRGVKTTAETVRVSLSDGTHTGRGESVPYGRYDETIESVTEQIESIRAHLRAGLSREELQSTLPAGAARCAVDCAMWDFDAKIRGKPVWALAGLPEPKPAETAITISLDTPGEMAKAAKQAPGKLLKLKLGDDGGLDAVQAVHAARPDARLILDANEGLTPDALPALVRAASSLGVALIEQPLPADDDDALIRRPGPIAICADEGAHTASDIEHLARRYDVVNVKLDKTGGLTEALAMVRHARTAGMGVMIGCMVAGSLSMAPAMMLAGLADYIDLDGPLWLADDIEHGLAYSGGSVSPPGADLWG